MDALNENGKRKYYKIAFLYLKKVKEIYIEILKDETEWEQKLFQIKIKNKKRSAFLDEIKSL